MTTETTLTLPEMLDRVLKNQLTILWAMGQNLPVSRTTHELLKARQLTQVILEQRGHHDHIG